MSYSGSFPKEGEFKLRIGVEMNLMELVRLSVVRLVIWKQRDRVQ